MAFQIPEKLFRRIKNRKTWKRYSDQTGGDAITFIQQFYNKSFPDAVSYLLSYNGRARDSHHWQAPVRSQPVEFVLPPANTNNRRVYAYLRKRGIAAQVINGFIQAGLPYEDAQYHNCVFAGRDSTGQPVFANKRGTCDQNSAGFKGDVSGSNKAAGFRQFFDPAIAEIYVFEAPIDLMSFCTLHREITKNAIALCCLHDGALETCLKENISLKNIILCLDADQPGQKAAELLQAKYRQKGYSVTVQQPPAGKDWNEFLLAKKNERGDAAR